MRSDHRLPNDEIDTADLTYTSTNGKYFYQFNYLGQGIFSLKSKGYIDETSFKSQILSGDIARQRLQHLLPQNKYYLLWDVSEVTGISRLSRHLAFTKVSATRNIGGFYIIGSNRLNTSFAKMICKIQPNANIYFYKSFTEAFNYITSNISDNKESYSSKNVNIHAYDDTYARFIDHWQQDQCYFSEENHLFKCLSKKEWEYESSDKSFRVKVQLIEGNIIYYVLEGFAKIQHIDATYNILVSIMREFGFNTTNNKFYSIVDIRKLKGITLSARKRTLYYEQKYNQYSHMVVNVPSKTLQLIYKFVKKINFDTFFHWEMAETIEEAFTKVLDHQKGATVSSIDQEKPEELFEKDLTTLSNIKLIDLIQNLREEKKNLISQQNEQIQKILEITGRMTWDETIMFPELQPNFADPFQDVFYSLSILLNDFKEILSEKTEHARRLEESEDKYRNLINLANDVIIVFQDETFRFINSSVKPLLGYNPEELIGKNLNGYVAPDEIPFLLENYRKRQLGEKVTDVYEATFIHKNGTHIPFSLNVGKINYENKTASLIIARDISQKKKNEEELEKYKHHLEEIIIQRTEQLKKEITDRRIAEESDRLKTAFLSNMSHEIRTPMNAIISFSTFLKDDNLTSGQKNEYLNYILSNGQSLLNLINDIIDISKIEAKQLTINHQYCDINSLLQEQHALFEEARKKQNKSDVSIELNIPSEKITAIIDSYRLKQILSNLLDNALKFTSKGSIQISYEIKDKNLFFSIKDSGEGIPADKLSKIFQRFGKIETDNKNIGGTGLGLAISKNLATLMGGDLWVESECGKGATFFLSLPFKESSKNEFSDKTSSISSKNTYHWKNKKILIAEDEDINFKVLQIALMKTDGTVIRALNGQEAVDLVKAQNNFDIVLMDIQMPEMDGYDALKFIKNINPKIPVIAQTAFALIDEQQRCIDFGFDDYVSKPIIFEELFKKMSRFL